MINDHHLRLKCSPKSEVLRVNSWDDVTVNQEPQMMSLTDVAINFNSSDDVTVNSLTQSLSQFNRCMSHTLRACRSLRVFWFLNINDHQPLMSHVCGFEVLLQLPTAMAYWIDIFMSFVWVELSVVTVTWVMLAVVFAWLFWLGSHPGQNAGLSEVWMSMSVSIPQMMHTFRGWIKPKIVTLTLTQTDRIAWPRIWTSLQPSAILSLSKQM